MSGRAGWLQGGVVVRAGSQDEAWTGCAVCGALGVTRSPHQGPECAMAGVTSSPGQGTALFLALAKKAQVRPLEPTHLPPRGPLCPS